MSLFKWIKKLFAKRVIKHEGSLFIIPVITHEEALALHDADKLTGIITRDDGSKKYFKDGICIRITRI